MSSPDILLLQSCRLACAGKYLETQADICQSEHGGPPCEVCDRLHNDSAQLVARSCALTIEREALLAAARLK